MDNSTIGFLRELKEKIEILDKEYYITPLFINDKPLIGIDGLLSSILEAPKSDIKNHFVTNKYVSDNNLELNPFKEITKFSMINYSDTSKFMIDGYLSNIFPNEIKDSKVPPSLIPKLEEMYKNNELIALSPKTSLARPILTLNIPCVETYNYQTVSVKDVLNSPLKSKRNVNRFLEKEDLKYPDNEDEMFNTFLYALYALENQMRFSVLPLKEITNYELFFPKLNEAKNYLAENVVQLVRGNNQKM